MLIHLREMNQTYQTCSGSHSPSMNSRARDPSEKSKYSREDIDPKHRAHQLPARPDKGARVDALRHARDQDDPRLRQRHLQEDNLLHASKVLDDAPTFKEHGASNDPGASRQENSHYRGDDPDFRQLPVNRLPFEGRVVVCDSDRRDTVAL